LHGLGDETGADSATEQVVVDPDLLRRHAGHLCGGRLGAACIAPAVVNAVCAATGKRLRKLPIDSALLKSA
jgi:CO/xanthine dehydrogenase Mo-binding subunit